MVVSTHLKNISQIGSFPQVGVKIKNIWNHHLDVVGIHNQQFQGTIIFMVFDLQGKHVWKHQKFEWDPNFQQTYHLVSCHVELLDTQL